MSKSTDRDVVGRAGELTPFKPPWGLVVPLALLILFALPTFTSLGSVWSSPDYSHGYLVLGLVILLVVVELRRAPFGALTPSWSGFLCLFGLALLTMAARAMTMEVVELLAWPLTWIAAAWAWTGWHNARRIALPLAYLVVAIPVWDVFVEPLQRLTVLVVSMWIRLAGMPAFIEGNLIHVPSGTFEVLGGCAGLRYALVALALTVFVGLFIYRRWQPTAILVSCALALVAVGNWLRVFITVAVGLSSEGPVSLVRDHHTLFGWLVFVLFMIPLAFAHRRLQIDARVDADDIPAVGRENSVARSVRFVPHVSGAILALGIWLTISMTEPGAELPRSQSFENPTIAGWALEANWKDSRVPVFDGATVESATWYSDGDARVGVYVAGFAEQRRGRDVSSLENGPIETTAVVVARKPITVTAVSGATLPFLELEVLERGDNRRLVWTSLRIAGKMTSTDLAAKILQLEGAVRGRHDAQVLVLTTVCRSACDGARTSLSRFAETAAEPIYERAENAVRRRGPAD